MADRLTELGVFARAIRLGSLSVAGRATNMSSAMAAPSEGGETQPGTTPVRRTTRRMWLTKAGRQCRDRTERLLAGLAEVEASAPPST